MIGFLLPQAATDRVAEHGKQYGKGSGNRSEQSVVAFHSNDSFLNLLFENVHSTDSTGWSPAHYSVRRRTAIALYTVFSFPRYSDRKKQKTRTDTLSVRDEYR